MREEVALKINLPESRVQVCHICWCPLVLETRLLPLLNSFLQEKRLMSRFMHLLLRVTVNSQRSGLRHFLRVLFSIL